LKLLDSASAKSHKAAEEVQKKIVGDTIGKIFLAEIFYFKCGQKNHLKRDYSERKK
jgi:hypothetical protein